MPGRGGRRDWAEPRSGPGCAVGLLVLVLFVGGCGLVFVSGLGKFPDLGGDLRLDLGCLSFDIVGSARLSTLASDPGGAPPLWTARLGHAPSSPPVVADGRVFVRTVAGEVVALDASAGTTLWTVRLGRPSPLATDFAPVVAGDALLVTDWDGVVHTLDAATGASRWSTALAANRATPNTPPYVTGGAGAADVFTLLPRSGAPLVVDADAVYVDGDALVALDRATGAPRWSGALAHSPTGGYSQPVLVADLVVVGAGAVGGPRVVDAFDRSTGARRWEAVGDPEAGDFAAPRVTATAAGLIVTGLETHAAVVLDAASGRALRRIPITGSSGPFGSVPVGVGDLALLRADRVSALDPATGAVHWDADVGGASGFDFAPPLVTDGTIVTPGGDGRLHALDAADGHERWVIGTPKTNRCNAVSRLAPPATTGSTMIAISAHRTVVALASTGGT